jgi:hypothetical protein
MVDHPRRAASVSGGLSVTHLLMTALPMMMPMGVYPSRARQEAEPSLMIRAAMRFERRTPARPAARVAPPDAERYPDGYGKEADNREVHYEGGQVIKWELSLFITPQYR